MWKLPKRNKKTEGDMPQSPLRRLQATPRGREMVDPECKGKKHGHNFLVPGASCSNGCGITQLELSNPKPKKAAAVKVEREEKKNIHSEAHSIADSMYTYFSRRESFGLFLGLIKRRGLPWGYTKLSEMRQYKKERGKSYPIQFVVKTPDKKNQ